MTKRMNIPFSPPDITDLEVQEVSEALRSGWITTGPRVKKLEKLLAEYVGVQTEVPNCVCLNSQTACGELSLRLLGIGPQDFLNDLNTFGLIFETLAVRDLRVYAESLDGKVYHYRDKNNLECDAVVHLRNGSYGLIEIKLGGADLINDGAESLKTLSDKIDTTKMKKPSFLMVLTGIGDYAYKRPKDGVLVVPIGCLRD